MRPGHGGARGQQDQGVEQRQMPGIEGMGALGRPDAAEQRLARHMHGIAREQRGVEEGPEPGHEEHDLGADEQDHAVAMADLHHAGVVALVLGFADHVRPPAHHGVEHADHADAENDRRGGGQMVHPHDGADGHDEGRDRAYDRPRTRVDKVVIMLDLRRSHCGLSPFAVLAVPMVLAPVHPKNQSCRLSKADTSVRFGRFSSQIFPLRLSGSLAATGFGAGSFTG